MDGMVKGLPTAVSRTCQTKLVLPPDTNHMGTIFGGSILSYIDEIGAISAMKHSGYAVVTASIDTVSFLSSARTGDILTLEGVVVSTGRTSMEIFVKVECMESATRETRLTTTAFMTMVAIDEEGRPVEVPAVIPETAEERRLAQNAKFRKQRRIESADYAKEM